MKSHNYAKFGVSLFCLLLFHFSCRKENEDTDREFFECYLNGKQWKPCTTSTFPSEDKLFGYVEGTQLSINASRHCNIDGKEVSDYFLLGSDTIGPNIDINVKYINFGRFIDGCNDYLTDTSYHKNYYKLTRYESPNGFVAGEFGIKLLSADCKDTVTITDGKFQLRVKN